MRKALNKTEMVALPEVSKVPELRCPIPAPHQGDGQLGRAGGPGASPALPLTRGPPGKVPGTPACLRGEAVLIGFLTVCVYFKG